MTGGLLRTGISVTVANTGVVASNTLSKRHLLTPVSNIHASSHLWKKPFANGCAERLACGGLSAILRFPFGSHRAQQRIVHFAECLALVCQFRGFCGAPLALQ